MTEAEYSRKLHELIREMHDGDCEICPAFGEGIRDGGCNTSEFYGRVAAQLVLLGAEAGKAGIIPVSR